MTDTQVWTAIVSTVFLTSIVYTLTGWRNILDCYKMWFDKKYWTNYNLIEAIAWIAKAAIIIPGLIFGIEIWELYFISLFTSMLLIWASYKKLLPTLVAFNTLWIWLSMMVIVQNLPFI